MNRIVNALLFFIRKSAENTAEKASPRGTYESTVPEVLKKKVLHDIQNTDTGTDS